MQDLDILVRVLKGDVKGPECSKNCHLVNNFMSHLEDVINREPDSGVLWNQYCLLHEKHCTISNV